MQKEDFAQLLQKYIRKECTEEEIHQLDRWYDRLGKDAELSLTPEQQQVLKTHLWQRINQRLTVADVPAKPETTIVRLNSFRWWMAAAAMAVLVGIGAVIATKFRLTSPNPSALVASSKDGMIEWTNSTHKAHSITLTDSSQVQLQPGSRIRYASQKSVRQREVWLTGNAFFQVKKDPKRPFFVYSGTVVTRVLGTSFWIKAPNNARAIEVSVRTGKVSVYKQTTVNKSMTELAQKGGGVVLTPNQKVTFFTDNSRLVTGLVAEPQPIKPAKQTIPIPFIFDESSLETVLQRLQKEYGIDMVIADETLKNCRFTGDITKQPLYTKLELICKSINAHYERQGTSIVVSGEGCTPL